MARRARAERTERPLPPPLPPAQRTVGQLVGEAIRAYAAQFWRALALGVPVVFFGTHTFPVPQPFPSELARQNFFFSPQPAGFP